MSAAWFCALACELALTQFELGSDVLRLREKNNHLTHMLVIQFAANLEIINCHNDKWLFGNSIRVDQSSEFLLILDLADRWKGFAPKRSLRREGNP